MRHAFHQTAITQKYVGAVIDEGMARTIELGGEQAFRQRHADRVGEPLAERAGGRFHARRDAMLGMPGRLRMQLPEAL